MADPETHSGLPTPAPYVSPETRPFWLAAKEGRFVLPFCTVCERAIWYPKAFCNACGALSVEWRDASGKATVYSFSAVHRGEGAYREVESFVLALVDLDEGPRVLTNIVDADPGTIEIGQRVQVVFHPASDDAALFRFAPMRPDQAAAAPIPSNLKKEN